jgi:D-sedoheptulose 7-phosphate isomerase
LKDRIHEIFEQSARTREEFLIQGLDELVRATEALIGALKQGHTLFIFGNGGSAADAQHMAAEFVNRYLLDRRPLPAMALTTDTSVLTSIANDFDYEDIFAKQLIALGKPGDAAIGISASGSSANVIKGLKAAGELKMTRIGLGGPKGSAMEEMCDYYLRVTGPSTARIQETHEIIYHAMVELAEADLFG